MTTVYRILEEKGRDVWIIDPDASVFDALEKFSRRNIGALVVMEAERVAGLFTERQYARSVFLKGKASTTTSVREVMLTDIPCVRPGSTVQECMAIMTDKKTRHLPVLKDGALVGLVSIGDLVARTISEQKFTIDQLIEYVHSSH